MKKKVLMVACVPVMIKHFNMPNITILQDMGYQVEVAFNCFEDEMWSKEDWEKFQRQLDTQEILAHQIDFTRSAGNIIRHFKAYKQLKTLVEREKYEFIHCHTPIAAAIARIVAHQTGTKIIYTAHGFHFFKGAPVKNWVLYYPVEKFLSRWTDCLITINKEDYRRAKKKFHAKRIEYVPGVGIDLEKFRVPDFIQDACGTSIPFLAWKQEKRRKLGVDEDDFVIISVGELNANKNHKAVIEAVAQMKNIKVKYLICGQGELRDKLICLIKRLELEKQVLLLGFRNDVKEILWVGDLFVFPSKREGLPVALMEAMVSGLPCIAYDIRGSRDLFEGEQKKYLLPADGPEQWKEYIEYNMKHLEEEIEWKNKNQERMCKYSRNVVTEKVMKIYEYINCIGNGG